MAITELTQSNFDNVVSQHNLIIIDFSASWCASRLSFTKIIEEVEKDYPKGSTQTKSLRITGF